MTPKKLPTDVSSLLFERLNDEYSAHYFYRQAANFCENAGYLKAAVFFEKESDDELEHAKGLQKYLTDWNVMPELDKVIAPMTVTSLVDIIEKAYTIEYQLYEEYESTSKIMLSKDLCTFVFLQKYMTIQRESVAEYSTFLNQLELIDKKDKNWVYTFELKAFKK